MIPSSPCRSSKAFKGEGDTVWFHWFYNLPPHVEEQSQCLCPRQLCQRSTELHSPSLGKIFLLEWFCIVM